MPGIMAEPQRPLLGDEPVRDVAATELFGEIGGWPGAVLASLTAAFDPEIIIVGGGMSQAGDLLLDPARDTFRRTLSGRASDQNQQPWPSSSA